jgi:translation initiation factor 1
MTTDIQNLKSFDPFAEAEDSVGDVKTTSQNYIHIRIQRKCPLPPCCVRIAPSHAC